jgi:type I restriction enzyme S subunit
MRAAAERQQAEVRELTATIVNRAFDAPAGEWPQRPIGEMALILSGYAFKSDWFSESGVRLLRNANVSQGSIVWTDTVLLPDDKRSDFGAYELRTGNIVLALDRPMVAEGLKVARLAKGDVPSLLLQRVATFRLSDALDAGYLYAFLRTRAFADAISGHEQSLGVPHVSPTQVSAVVLPIPPIARQRDVVRALDDALCSVSSVSAAIEGQAAEIRRLPASLLRRAFSEGS